MFPWTARYLHGRQCLEAFCQEHGIARSQLMYWRRKYMEVPFPVRRDGGASIALQFPGGAGLRVFSPVPSLFLSALIHGEDGRSC